MTRPPSSLPPASYAHCWAGTWSSLLTGWLGFGQVGLEPSGSHPLGNNNPFHGVPSIPKVSGLPWREQAVVSVPPTLRLGSLKMKQSRRLPPPRVSLHSRSPVFPSSPHASPARRPVWLKKARSTRVHSNICPFSIHMPQVSMWGLRSTGSVCPRSAMPSLARHLAPFPVTCRARRLVHDLSDSHGRAGIHRGGLDAAVSHPRSPRLCGRSRQCPPCQKCPWAPENRAL